MIRLLAKYLRPYRPQLIWVVLLQLTQSVASLFLPSINALIIDCLLYTSPSPRD